MRNLHYFSSSIFPSNKANSVHTACQVDSLSKYFKVYFYFSSNNKSKDDIIRNIQKSYDLKFENIEIIPIYIKKKSFNTFKIGFFSFVHFMKNHFKSDSILYSRNMYASLFFSIFNYKIYNETHLIEIGWKSLIQKIILRSEKTISIVISNALKNILVEKYNIIENKNHVLHDSGPKEIASNKIKISLLKKVNLNYRKDKFRCGYFGSIYRGRGIQIILDLAKLNPNFSFYIFHSSKEKPNFNNIPNIYTYSLSFSEVKQFLSLFDVLLMPYQKSVSINENAKYDTVIYMSPLKMFEYMLSGVPIISSNLKVLKEVLIDEENSLLVEPDDSIKWSKKLNEVYENYNYFKKIGLNAKELSMKEYTWDKRAYKINNIIDEKN